MDASDAAKESRHVLVVIPNWVGDVVLATPVLAALRAHFAAARITYLCRRYVAEILEGGGWHDELVYWPAKRDRPKWGLFELARTLGSGDADLALLLTNSFRSALATRLAGIPRRVGYAREWRSWLLTERLRPLKKNGRFVPSPMLDYYCKLAERVGCRVTDRKLRLGVSDEQESAAVELKRHYGLDDGRPYALINPGAAFGAAKCWAPERFAAVCDRLADAHGFQPVVVGAPAEAALMRAIAEQAHTNTICCDKPGTTLGSLKALVRDAALLVCNDTGPRHYGNAFDVPTVTIFGPTWQEWTNTDYAGEIKLQVAVECGPCMLRTCPLDHRCMREVSAEMVVGAAEQLLQQRA